MGPTERRRRERVQAQLLADALEMLDAAGAEALLRDHPEGEELLGLLEIAQQLRRRQIPIPGEQEVIAHLWKRAVRGEKGRARRKRVFLVQRAHH
jgi:hypothetical protein